MDITLNNPLKIKNFDYLCGLRPPRLCSEKNMHIIAQQLNKVSTNKWRINIIFVNICRKKIISQMVRACPRARMVVWFAKQHTIFESFRMVLNYWTVQKQTLKLNNIDFLCAREVVPKLLFLKGSALLPSGAYLIYGSTQIRWPRF